jgi:hypothetical protein
MRRKITKMENNKAKVMNRASGAESVDVEETSEAIKPFSKNENEKIIDFPKELIKRMQYEIKKTAFNSDDFTRISFVSKALDYDKYGRRYKRIVKIEVDSDTGKRAIIGTDGKRLHIAQIDYMLPEGLYNIKIKSDGIIFQEPDPDQDEDMTYPNYKKFLYEDNDLEEVCELDLISTSLTKNVSKNAAISRQFAKVLKKAEKIINIRYLDDLAKLTWKLYVPKKKGPNSALVFKIDSEKELLAMIAPMGDDEE